MGKIGVTVKTADCPCKGLHAWMWHKDRGYPQCEHSRKLKYSNYGRWLRNVERERQRVQRVLSEDPAEVPWVEGASIYVDEEEGAA